MQLIITHKTEPELVLPINYHHILQSIIFKAIEKTPEYEKNIHDYGYENGKRIYKLFPVGSEFFPARLSAAVKQHIPALKHMF